MAKVFGQALVATVFALLAIGFPDANRHHSGIYGHQRGQRRFRGSDFAVVGGIVGVTLDVLWTNRHRHLDGEWRQCCRRT